MSTSSAGSSGPRPHDLFSSYYEQHYTQIQAYTRRRLPEEAARDATAEVFTTAWRRWEKAAPGGLPWLYITASHVVATAHRSTQRRTALLDRAAAQPETTAVPDHAEGHAERARVLAAVRQLPERDRELLLLTVWEEVDVPTAAQIVGSSTGAAHVRLHRARRRLRLLLAVTPSEPQDAVVTSEGAGNQAQGPPSHATKRVLSGGHSPAPPSSSPPPPPRASLNERSIQEVRP